MIDIDHFKKFNDTHGHPIGDKVLILVSTTIRDAVVGKGRVFRCGGEEIVVLLPNHEESEAFAVAERVRRAVESAQLPEIEEHITVSLGLSTFPQIAKDCDQLYEQADKAMYASKKEGRNRTTLASGGERAIVPNRSPQNAADVFKQEKISEARSMLARLTYAERDLIRFLLKHGKCSNYLVGKAAQVGDQITYQVVTRLPQLGIVERVDDLSSGGCTFTIGENWREIFTEILFPRDEGGKTPAFGLQ